MTPAVTLHALCDAINRRVDALAEATREHERIELRVSIHADVALLRSIAVSHARASEAPRRGGFCGSCGDFKVTLDGECSQCRGGCEKHEDFCERAGSVCMEPAHEVDTVESLGLKGTQG